MIPNWRVWSVRLKWILTCLVFFALPFLLVLYGLGNTWSIQERESIDGAYAGLDSLLLAIRRKDDTPRYLSGLFRLIVNRAEKNGVSLDVLGRGLHAMRTRFPDLFEIIVVRRDGTIIKELTDGNPPRAVVRKLVAAISQPTSKGTRQALKESWNLLLPFIGFAADVDVLDSMDEDFEVVSAMVPKRYFGYTMGESLGLLIHAHHHPQWDQLAVHDIQRQFLKYRGTLGIGVGLVNLTDKVVATSSLGLALAGFEETSRQHIRVGDRLFSIIPFTDTFRMWASRPAAHALDYTRLRLLLVTLGTLLCGIMFTASFLVMVRGWSFSIPIRLRLIILFTFASGLPLAVVLLAGWDYLNQKFKSRVRETHDEAERALRAFDVRFPQMRARMEMTFKKMLAGILFEDSSQLAAAGELFQRMAGHYSSDHMVVFDEMGQVAWDSEVEQPKWKGNRGRKLLGSISGNVLANINQVPFRGKNDAALMFIESFSGGLNPIVHLTRNVARVVDFTMAGNSNWIFNLPLYGQDRKARYMLTTNWRTHELEGVYIRRSLLRAQRALPGTKLFAFATKGGGHVPRDFPLKQRLEKFIREIRLRQGTTIGRLPMTGYTYLLTGIKPKDLGSYFLVALVSDAPIRQEIALIRQKLEWFALGMGFISIFLGVLLSERFLTPIGELTAGVRAIEDRRFQHRVPVLVADELGELARTFNHVMEGLSDLEVGRIVQESLFPQAAVLAGDCRIFGISSSASELGGDYFDLRILDDGKVLILIGDVSGHGVPAALVMAMAKALVERESEMNPAPDNILSVVHRVMFRTLKRKRMMSCFLALLDPEANLLSHSNAGHNYPVLYRSDEPPLFLKSSSFPLGSKRKNLFAVESLELQPGDRLLMYTDGLVEARAAGGSIIGYERMTDLVRPFLADDAEKSCRDIMEWHVGLTGGGRQEDDITILLLTRASL